MTTIFRKDMIQYLLVTLIAYTSIGCPSVVIIAVTCDLQQCGIFTGVDSDEPVQPLLSLETPNVVRSVA